jgi:hypothetical protein
MSHPNNQSHPEPMRVWPLEANQGRGDMFFQFCPIRHKEWKIEPQQSYEQYLLKKPKNTGKRLLSHSK